MCRLQCRVIFLGFVMFLFQAYPCFAAKPSNYLSIKGASYWWTVVTHPAEAITHHLKGKNTCAEEQHCLPQHMGGSDNTTVYWAKSNHSVSDRWRDRGFFSKHDNFLLSIATLGNDESQGNLNIAYRMGEYGLPYSVFFNDYAGTSSSLVSYELDGPSMIVYGVSWLLHMPGKLVNQIAYTIEAGTEPNLFYLIDIVLALFVFAADLFFGVIFTSVGVIVGFIFHPINSLCSIFGMFYFIVPILWTSIVDIFFGIVRMLPFL